MRTVTSLLLATLFVSAVAHAGSIGGTAFEDRNRNGVQDTGEPGLRGVRLQLLGADGAVIRQASTATDGGFLFSSLADGEYVLSAVPRAGVRASLQDLGADPDPIPDFPFGRPRYASPSGLAGNLRRAGQQGAVFLHMGLGDSIGFGFNVCGSLFGEDGYFEPTTDRLAGTAAGAVVGDKQSIPGHETSDLLVPGISGDFPFTYNDIFHAVDEGAGLVSISIGGNDFLGPDGDGDAALAAALVTARKNLQEAVSNLVSELPASDVVINTVYDNLQGDDPVHNLWVPIWDQVLREVAWGQERRVTVAEIWPEYAHDEGGQVLGERDLICDDLFGLDGIHPTNRGYDLHEEKVWQAFGGVTLSGGADRLDLDLGFLRANREQTANSFDDVGGTTVDPGQALLLDGVGALVPSDGGELRLVGFALPQTPNLDLGQAVLHVRYRTTGAPLDDLYVIEASVDGTFAPPGSTATTWNTILPVVGSAGNDGAEPLAYPDQPVFRTVAAPLYAGAPTGGAGTLGWSDLDTLSVRIVTAPVGAPDGYAVEVDAAWVELFTVPAGSGGASDLMTLAGRDPRQAGRIARERLASVPEDAGAAAVLAEVGTEQDLALARRLGTAADPLVRAHAVRLLARLGELSTADLSTLLTDVAPGVRRVAARALDAAETSRPRLAARLLADPDPGVRLFGVRAAARDATGSPDRAGLGDGLELLLSALGDADRAVRVEAAAALLRQGDDRGVDLLLEAVASPPGSRRARTALRRATFGTGVLRRDLTHPDPERRALAAKLLGMRGATEAERASLRALLADEVRGVRLAAGDALSRLGDEAALDDLLGLVADEPVAAAVVLARYDDARVWRALADLSLSAAPGTARRIAARALALAATQGTGPLLTGLLAADDAQVRRLAAAGLGQLE